MRSTMRNSVHDWRHTLPECTPSPLPVLQESVQHNSVCPTPNPRFYWEHQLGKFSRLTKIRRGQPRLRQQHSYKQADLGPTVFWEQILRWHHAWAPAAKNVFQLQRIFPECNRFRSKSKRSRGALGPGRKSRIRKPETQVRPLKTATRERISQKPTHQSDLPRIRQR